MLAKFLPPFLRGILAGLGHALIIVVLGIFIFIIAFCKILPIPSWQRACNHLLNKIPIIWTDANDYLMRLLTKLDITVIGDERLTTIDWYLMTANHQSWTDVLLLYRVFNHRLPVLKFFMKSQLMWIPILGWGCYLIGYPFMKRYTKEQIAKNPSLKGKDLATTKKMCERFKSLPMTIISFAEGTRYTPEKAARQQTPYRHLLKPRAGGLAYTLMAMSDYLHQFINVTIVYPDGKFKFLDYLCGNIPRVVIIVKQYQLDESWFGDYENNREYRAIFQKKLNDMWIEKDQEIEQILEQYKKS